MRSMQGGSSATRSGPAFRAAAWRFPPTNGIKLAQADYITLNPAVDAARNRPVSIGATHGEKSGCHAEGDLRRSWNLLATSAEPGVAQDELPDLGRITNRPPDAIRPHLRPSQYEISVV